MKGNKVLKISLVLLILVLMLPLISASIWDPFSLSKLKDDFVTYTNWKRNVDGSGFNITANFFKGDGSELTGIIDNDNQRSGQSPYLYNDSDDIIFNGTYGNQTTNASIDLRANLDFLRNILDVIYVTFEFLNINYYNRTETDVRFDSLNNLSNSSIISLVGPHTNRTNQDISDVMQNETIVRSYNTSWKVNNATNADLLAGQSPSVYLDDTTVGNCSVSGICSNVAFMDYNNIGNFNITGNQSVGEDLSIGSGTQALEMYGDGSNFHINSTLTGDIVFYINSVEVGRFEP